MPDSQEYLGFVELSGEGVEEGLLDARKQAKALIGFDSSLRFFVGRQIPELQEAEYEIPVRVKEGSWQALVPQTIEAWRLAAGGLAFTAYVTAAANKMGQNDFENIGLKDVFLRSIQGIQWFIRIGKHFGELTKKKIQDVRWRNDNTEVGIPNSEGEYLFVPIKFFEWYHEAPRSLLSDLAEVVSKERQLNVAVLYPDHVDTVSVTQNEKHVFFLSEETDEILFPDLKHGERVELEGFVTRGNGQTNTIGFMYSGHILTCYPATGDIVRFKQALFLECRIVGTITRTDKFGGTNDLRPKIKFDDLVPLQPDSDIQYLFEE